MKLPPYPEYKDSGVPWLGKIPAHWDSRKLRNMLTPVSDRNRPDLPLLSVVREKGVIKRNVSNKEENHNFIPDDLSNYKVVKRSQFAINKMKAWQGSYGVSDLDGIVSPAYFVFDLGGAEGKFFHVAVRSKAYVPFFTQASDGVRVGQWDLNQSRMKEIPFFIPPVDEQTQIARFLDWKTAQINRFIRNKRRLIELLKEQKQNVINQAVTGKCEVRRVKGENGEERLEAFPTSPLRLRPSGVEWIGDIPEHWEVAPLKHLASINTRVLPESTDENYTFKYFDISSVGTGLLSGKPETLRFGQAPSRARRILKKGDTILSTVRTYLKAVYYVADEVEDWIASTGFAALTPKKEIHPPFLGLLIQSDNFINRVIRESIGVAYPAIAETKLGTLHLAYPVSFEEQQEILEHIADSSKAIDKAVSRAEREIELMREYRTRLISDVVTGKFDVRNVKCEEVEEDTIIEEETAEYIEDVDFSEGIDYDD